MKLLLAEDDPATCGALEMLATQWGYAVTAVGDGAAAWEVLQQADAPRLALLDWMMPIMDGLEVCRRARQQFVHDPPYLILVTGHDTETDLVAALGGGADEYVQKPVSPAELQVRLKVGQRVVELQTRLAERVRELEKALASVKQLQGLLPICSYCKKIRDDHNYWRQLEEYISAHSPTQFSHSICPDCYQTIVGPELNRLLDSKSTGNANPPGPVGGPPLGKRSYG
jgi:CheY-like chemotaxis protein